jgi:hypothetical protein
MTIFQRNLQRGRQVANKFHDLDIRIKPKLFFLG